MWAVVVETDKEQLTAVFENILDADMFRQAAKLAVNFRGVALVDWIEPGKEIEP
jgi:hypothetical protein